MTSFTRIQLDLGDDVALLTVDRPEKLNALDGPTLAELREAVAEIGAAERVRAAIVTGAGDRAFVAGADIQELGALDAISGGELARRGQEVFRAIEQSRKPFIAAVNGFALGGGCELALACHLRVASSNARFGLPEVKLGLIPGYGGTVRLPRLVGKGRALEMMLTGEMMDAAEAHRIGLANRVVPPGELMEAARALARTIAGNGPLAVAMALDSVNRGMDLSVEDALGVEADRFALLCATEDMREGTTAFLQKRAPEFRGR